MKAADPEASDSFYHPFDVMGDFPIAINITEKKDDILNNRSFIKLHALTDVYYMGISAQALDSFPQQIM